MKSYLKTIFLMALVVLVSRFSGVISKEIKQGYNQCIALMANNTVGLAYFEFQ